MPAYRFRGEIKHTEETILLLFRTQYRTFCRKQMLTRLLGGIALIFAAGLLSAAPMGVRGVFLIIGAWLTVSLDFPSQAKADHAMVARRGILPDMKYVFGDNDMEISGEGTMRMRYEKLIRLVETPEYLFLFSGPESVCMVSRAGITPSDEKLKQFLTEKTHLEWITNGSFLTLNFYELRQIFQDALQLKKGKTQKPRLQNKKKKK